VDIEKIDYPTFRYKNVEKGVALPPKERERERVG
jgi:hypothetical protein